MHINHIDENFENSCGDELLWLYIFLIRSTYKVRSVLTINIFQFHVFKKLKSLE